MQKCHTKTRLIFKRDQRLRGPTYCLLQCVVLCQKRYLSTHVDLSVCCSVLNCALQCVAVCCSALRCVKPDICHSISTHQCIAVCFAVCCSVLQCVAMCGGVLQCVVLYRNNCLSPHVDSSVCCSALQCALQRVAVRCMVSNQMIVTPCRLISVWQYVAACFAVCCSVLQCIALYQTRCLSPHVDSRTSVRLFRKSLFCKRALPKYISFAKERCPTFD